MATKPNRIRKVEVHNLKVSMCLVAESGWGKTVFAGTAPRALFLSADPEGTDSAAFQGTEADEWVIRTYEDIDEAYRYIRDGGHKEYDWLIIDSAPEYQKILMRNALNTAVKQNPKRDSDIPAQADYQKTQIQFLELVKRHNDLPINVLYTAAPAEYTDADGEPYYLPSVHGISGDIARSFMGYMKIQLFGVYKEKTADGKKVRVRRCYAQNSGPYKAKDRFDALGNFKDDLTIPAMMGLIAQRAGITTTTKPATTGRRRVRKATAS